MLKSTNQIVPSNDVHPSLDISSREARRFKVGCYGEHVECAPVGGSRGRAPVGSRGFSVGQRVRGEAP
jgi:hypothetical protein